MSIIVSDYGEMKLLQSGLASANIEYRLFVNNHTPTDSDSGDPASIYTEASFSGYGYQTATFGSSAGNTGGVARIVGSSLTFQADSSIAGSQSIYGYWCTYQTDSTNLAWAELLPSPVTIASPGDAVIIIPAMSLHSEF